MKNSRSRSTEKSREPILKKPRLAEEAQRDPRSSNGVTRQQYPQRLPPTAAGILGTGPNPRSAATAAAIEKEGDDYDDDDDDDDDVGEREISTSRGGGAYLPQQQQELLIQYRNALAELTINSKPIITNLTIIAGENVHAAKGIANAIYANILEVPAEHKLPSLYLLDSIVKNIGRDYIKNFAVRLPEVFCKAYRQVESSIRPGMRHLFGTWKRVFPSVTLQTIEKELGFPPIINGSSSGVATARSDSQSQQSPHSIHVNPKYLEARKHLQQSSRSKGTTDVNTGTIVTTFEDSERPDETDYAVNGRPWTDASAKMNNIARPQREALSKPFQEKNSTAGYDDHGYSSDSSRNSDMGMGRSNERIIEGGGLGKLRYGAGSINVKAKSSQMNGFDSKHGFPNHRAPKPAQVVTQLQPTQSILSRSSRGMSRNWKNAEEEEYTWGDMKSRLIDLGDSNSSRKDGWTPGDAEYSGIEDHLMQTHGDRDIRSIIDRETSADSRFIAQKGQVSGQLTSSMRPLQEKHPMDVLNHMNSVSRISGKSEGYHPTSLSGLSTSMDSSLAKPGHQPFSDTSTSIAPSIGSLINLLSGSSGALAQRGYPLGPASPSGGSIHMRSQSPLFVHQHTRSQKLTERDQSFSQTDINTSQLAGKWYQAPHIQKTQDASSSLLQNLRPDTLQNLRSLLSQPVQHLQTSSSSLFPSLQGLFSQKPQSEGMQSQDSQRSDQIQKTWGQPPNFETTPTMGYSASSHSNDSTSDIQGHLSTSSLLAQIMKSQLPSSHSVSGGLTFPDSNSLLSHANNVHAVPSGLPTQVANSSIPKATLSKSKKSALMDPRRSTLPPRMPPGALPTSSHTSSTSASLTSNVDKVVPNPLSSLLSSLVVKGLISSSATESRTLTASEMPRRFLNKSPDPDEGISMRVSSDPVSAGIPMSSAIEHSLSETDSQSTNTLSEAVSVTEKKDLIGIEFRPETMREFHAPVISSLFDDLVHRCSICGLRLKLQEQLDQHLAWHAMKKSEPSSDKRFSRTWFASLDVWVNGIMGLEPEPTSTVSVDGMVKPDEESGLVLPADECQSVCVLCGEPFEDFYSHEKDEWMYKQAVYITIPAEEGKIGSTNESASQGPIVHPNCLSPSSVFDLGLA